MIMGGLMLVQATDGRERMRGLVFTIIGTWLFLNMQGLITIRLWELFWPAILILIGLSMVMRRGGRPQWRRDIHERMRGAREARWAGRHPPPGGGPAMGFDACLLYTSHRGCAWCVSTSIRRSSPSSRTAVRPRPSVRCV